MTQDGAKECQPVPSGVRFIRQVAQRNTVTVICGVTGSWVTHGSCKYHATVVTVHNTPVSLVSGPEISTKSRHWPRSWYRSILLRSSQPFRMRAHLNSVSSLVFQVDMFQEISSQNSVCISWIIHLNEMFNPSWPFWLRYLTVRS
jgi:hypothetical protein